MRNTLETRLGIFVALAMIAAFIILEMVGGTEIFKRGYRVSALFDSVQELTVGAPVKMAGVPIGRVETVGFAGTDVNKVKVTLKLDRNALVRTDSKATIRFTGLMGQNFVSIDFGSAGSPRALDGAVLDSVEQPDFSALVAKLDKVAGGVEKLTSTFTGDTLDNLLGPLTDFVKQNRESLTATFTNLQAISTQIAQGKGTVGRLIYEDTLFSSALTTVSNLNATGDEVKLAVADARKVIDGANTIVAQVNAGQGTIGKLFKEDTLYRETTASMTSLKEILEKVNKGDGTAGKIVNDPALYKNANMTLQKLDKATESLEDQGVISVLGIAVGRLF